MTETIENYLPLQQNSYGALRKFVLFYQKNLVRLPESMMKVSVKLITTFRGRLGDEYYLILEDLFHASIECQQFETAELVLTKLKEKFENAPKIIKLTGIYKESVGQKKDAEAAYKEILSEDRLNVEARKRKIALLRTNEETNKAVSKLKKFLEKVNFCDKEAWLELADIYLEKLSYENALYCYEQVCLLAPRNMYYFIRCAEIRYTLGGHVNLGLARNYYTYALYFEDENLPAIFGLIKTCKGIEALNKGNTKNKEILALAQKRLKIIYQAKNPHLLENLPL